MHPSLRQTIQRGKFTAIRQFTAREIDAERLCVLINMQKLPRKG
jgi:hypothetical protein